MDGQNSSIDVTKTLERLKQETGLNWWDGTHGGARIELICVADGITRRLKERHDGSWGWRHETDIAKHRDYTWDISADIAGTSPTLDEAIAALMAFAPLPPVQVGGISWHDGSGSIACHASGESRIAVIGGQAVTVHNAGDHFSWSRPWDALDGLRALGMGFNTELTGTADTFEDAALAAVAAPDKLRADLKAWLADGEQKPRQLPGGAAAAFLDVCCSFEDVGVIDSETVSRPVSPVVRAHVLAALGNETPAQFYPPRSANAKRIAAFAGYLESVSAQLRAEIGEG